MECHHLNMSSVNNFECQMNILLQDSEPNRNLLFEMTQLYSNTSLLQWPPFRGELFIAEESGKMQ